MFESLIDEDSFYLGYDSLTIAPEVALSSTRFLIESLASLIIKYDFLINERKKPIEKLTEEEVAEIITGETKTFFIDPENPTPGYDISEAIAGTMEIQLLQYFSNRQLFEHCIVQLAERGIDTPLDKKQMIGIFKSFQEIQELPKRTIADIIADTELELNYKISEILPEGLQIITFSANILDLARFGYFSECTAEIMQIFEQLRCIDSENLQDRAMIFWHVRCDEEYYIDDAEEAVEFVGRYYLRSYFLMNAGKTPENPCKLFDDYRIKGIRDEFRYHVARSLGILDERKSIVTILDGREMNSFENQYKSMGKNKRKQFDEKASEILNQIAEKYDLKTELRMLGTS